MVREDSIGLSVPIVLYPLAKQNNAKRNSSRKRTTNGRNRPDPSMGPINSVVRYSPSNVFGFPDRLMVRLRYHEGQSMTSTTGGLTTYKFRLNSLFDPNFTGTGHQPMYRDTYASIYNYYAVVSTVAKVRFNNITGNPFWAGAVIEDDSSTTSGIDPIIEQNHSKSKYLSTAYGNSATSEVVINWDCKKILNIDPYTSQAYKTAMSSNPTEESYLIVYGATADSTTQTLYFDVTLDFTVLVSELQTPTQS